MFKCCNRLVFGLALGAVFLPGFAHAHPAQCKNVAANLEWQSTGVAVVTGQLICLKAEGFWTVYTQPIYTGPNGYLAHNDPGAVVPNAPIASLIYRVRGATEAFVAGEQACFVARSSGPLELSINDVPTTFGNNSGQMRVGITRAPEPATYQPGLLDAMFARIDQTCFGK